MNENTAFTRATNEIDVLFGTADEKTKAAVKRQTCTRNYSNMSVGSALLDFIFGAIGLTFLSFIVMIFTADVFIIPIIYFIVQIVIIVKKHNAVKDWNISYSLMSAMIALIVSPLTIVIMIFSSLDFCF